MGLFRTRLTHRIFIAVDYALQKAQRRLNALAGMMKKSVSRQRKSGNEPNPSLYKQNYGAQAKVLQELKEQLLAEIKRVDEEIGKLEEMAK